MPRSEPIESALRSASSLLVDDVREAAADLPEEGIFFGVRTAISGPFAVLSVHLGFESLLPETVYVSDSSWVLDVTAAFESATFPVTIRWRIGAGHDIPRLATYLIVNGRVGKLGDKRSGLEKGKTWPGERRLGARVLNPGGDQ